MLFARCGVYAAIALAVGSALLAMNAGMASELAMMRAIFVFVVFTLLGFGAEAVFTMPASPVPAPARSIPEPRATAAAPDEVDSE
jgi:hypothetical protein